MSRITNIILVHSLIEEEEEEEVYPVLTGVNEWLQEQQGFPLTRIDQHAGGPKEFTLPLYAYCANHLDEDGFVAVVRNSPWKYPDEVRLWLEGEGGELQEFRVGQGKRVASARSERGMTAEDLRQLLLLLEKLAKVECPLCREKEPYRTLWYGKWKHGDDALCVAQDIRETHRAVSSLLRMR